MHTGNPLLLATAMLLTACATAQPTLPDIRIMDTQVFPESITSTQDGTVFVGSVKGIVYRAAPCAAEAHAWITHSEANGILTILGVLADESSNTLWLCSVPNFFGPERSQGLSSLKAFDLQTATLKASYDFPAPASVCNDLTIAVDGAAYVADTSNGRILRLEPGATALAVWGADPTLVGIDGLAFSSDGTLYVNNVRTNQLIRVAINADGSMGTLTPQQLSHELGGPDGMRLIDGNRFIQAEGTAGRLGIVSVENDSANLTVLRDDLESSPGATVVGNTAYVIESNIQYLLAPELKGKEPPAFMLYAVPLP
jgi:sugar lactone lactonase YvrE